MAASHRILILEDNPADAELVQFELHETGLAFCAMVVETENDFVHALQHYTPDLILSDYDLPAYNGALALQEARRRRPDTPFILVTGAVGEDRAIEILTQGAKDYVLKNRLSQRLGASVQRALSEAQEHRARKQAEHELRETHRALEERVHLGAAALRKEIEARKRLEASLRESETKYQVILEGSLHGILAVDIETKRFLFANPAICQMLGYSEEALLRMGIADIHPRNARDRVMAEFDRLLQGERMTMSPLPCLRKDGTIVYAYISGSAIVDLQGRRCIVGFFESVNAG